MGPDEDFGITPELVALVKRYEGWSAKAYFCPAGYPTIGWGHLLQGITHPPITVIEGERLLRGDLRRARDGALRLSPTLVRESPRRVAAVVDFCYNVGAGKYRASTLRRKVRVAAWPEAATQMRKWVYGGGKKLRGLVLRRAITATWLEAA